MNKKTVTVGTVGAGYAARLHGNGYARVSGINVRLKTICDVNLELANAIKEQYGYEQAISDIKESFKVLGDDYAAMLAQNGLEHAEPGTVLSDGKTYLAFATEDGAISATEIQLAGKKRMPVKDFLIGFREPMTYGTTEGTSSRITGR